jgi:hypothetical protein
VTILYGGCGSLWGVFTVGVAVCMECGNPLRQSVRVWQPLMVGVAVCRGVATLEGGCGSVQRCGSPWRWVWQCAGVFGGGCDSA